MVCSSKTKMVLEYKSRKYKIYKLLPVSFSVENLNIIKLIQNDNQNSFLRQYSLPRNNLKENRVKELAVTQNEETI